MRLLLLVLIALVLALGVVILTAHDSGLVEISMSGWSIQTSLVFFAALLLALFLVMYAGLRLLSGLLAAPSELRRWRSQRRQQQAEKYLIEGLLALIENRAQDAEDKLVRGARLGTSPLIYYLCAARAAQRQGRIKQRDHYLQQATGGTADEKIALGLTQSELQINQQQAELAQTSLARLHNEYPSHRQIRLLLLRAYMELHAWTEVLALLPVVEKARQLPDAEILSMKIAAYAGLLQRAGATSSKKRLDGTWREIPKKLRRTPSLLKVYVLEKLKFADTADCEPLLQQALQNHRDPELITLYGLVEGSDAARQLEFAERLAAVHDNDANLLLALGRLCLRNSLWGKAQTYLKRSLDQNPMPEVCYELGRLHEGQGDYSRASAYYKQGLALATSIARHEAVRLQEQVELADEMTAGARQVY